MPRDINGRQPIMVDARGDDWQHCWRLNQKSSATPDVADALHNEGLIEAGLSGNVLSADRVAWGKAGS